MEKMTNAPNNRENRFGFYPGVCDNRNIFVYPIPTHDYVIYVEDLSWLEDHQERLQLIRMATPEDSIRIVINSPGGVVSIAMAYVNAMAESAANIVTHAEGNVCSAGTILWLAGEDRTVSPLTLFMFHNYQGGTWGDGANMHSQVVFEKAYFERLVERFYGGVLSKEEISRIQGGGQVWMDETEILTRTSAVLLDSKNIKRMQQGKPPVKAQKEKTTPAKEGCDDQGDAPKGEKKVKINIILNGEEFVLEALHLNEKNLARFSTKELLEILVQIARLSGADLFEESTVNGDTSREDLIIHLGVYGKAVSDSVLSQQEG